MTCIPTKRYKRWQKFCVQSLQMVFPPPRRNNIHSWSLSPSLPTRKQKHMAQLLKGSLRSLSFLMFFVVKLLKFDYDYITCSNHMFQFFNDFQNICVLRHCGWWRTTAYGLTMFDFWPIQVWPEFAKTWPAVDQVTNKVAKYIKNSWAWRPIAGKMWRTDQLQGERNHAALHCCCVCSINSSWNTGNDRIHL